MLYGFIAKFTDIHEKLKKYPYVEGTSPLYKTEVRKELLEGIRAMYSQKKETYEQTLRQPRR